MVLQKKIIYLDCRRSGALLDELNHKNLERGGFKRKNNKQLKQVNNRTVCVLFNEQVHRQCKLLLQDWRVENLERFERELD